MNYKDINYKDIIKKAKKYHYFITSTNKIVLLSSSNSKTEAKNLALEKLKPNIDNFINKNLVLIKIKNVKKKYDEDKKDKHSLKLVGGPLVFKIERGHIVSATQIKNEIESGNNLFYLSNKYIKKNIDNIAVDLKKVISDYFKKLYTNSLIDINIL